MKTALLVLLSLLRMLDETPQQKLEVTSLMPGGVEARLQRFIKRNGDWVPVGGAMQAVVGRSGIASKDKKREGDGCTPSGVYRLQRAFGYAPTCATRLDYRPVSEADLWIDDPEHEDYNLWKQAPTTAKSFERLRRDDGAYELAVVIEYNTSPITAGKGSAIFLHVWDGPHRGTAGCVAVAREDLLTLLDWLDPKKFPVIEIALE